MLAVKVRSENIFCHRVWADRERLCACAGKQDYIR